MVSSIGEGLEEPSTTDSSVNSLNNGGDTTDSCGRTIMGEPYLLSNHPSPAPVVSNFHSMDHHSNSRSSSQNGAVKWTKEISNPGTDVEKLELMKMNEKAIAVNFANRESSMESAVVLNLDCGCRTSSSRVGHLVNVILVVSNMLNYMDRYTIAGTLYK